VSGLDIESVRRRLPGRRIEAYDRVGSTMLIASELPPGSVVVAEEQTAGQGRHGHSWHSEAGSGLYCSIVLDLPVAVEHMPVVTLALGLATVEAIARVTDLRCDLRWPNDVMIGPRKAAGILVQSREHPGALDRQRRGRAGIPRPAAPAAVSVVAGIGINVNHYGFPEDIAHLATSLRLAAGREISREDLLSGLLASVDSFCKMMVDGGKDTIIEAFTRYSSYACGKRVEVEQPEGPVRGVTAGLDSHGFLRVRRENGEEVVILAGGVRDIGA
jgi:BirA family biotin operon repressor/biotin-[acetyl-CoA-carboxylase] ligase